MNSKTKGHSHIAHALQYYIQCLRSTRSMLGRPLAEALRVLKTRPILHDPGVLQLEDLDLDTLHRWIARDIQDFVPFIKYNDLAKTDIDFTTSAWSGEAFDIFIELLGSKLALLDSTAELLALRRELLETWLPNSVSTPVHSKSEILSTLRRVLNQRLNDLISTESVSLAVIGTTIVSTITEQKGQTWQEPSIWEQGFTCMAVGKGAIAFKQQLTTRHLGTTEIITYTLEHLQGWISRIKATESVIQQLRKNRWQDQVEDDEVEDEGPVKIESLLAVEDPDLYEQKQAAAVLQAVSSLQGQIQDAINIIKDSQGSPQIQVLLRIIREVRQRLGHAFMSLDLTGFENVVPALHEQLAELVAAEVLAEFMAPPTAARLNHVASIHLFDGSPSLPTHPSPHIFKLLYKLNSIMAERGGDLWTPSAVIALKRTFTNLLIKNRHFESDSGPRDRELNGFNNGATILNGPAVGTSGTTHASQMQNLFDIHYLQFALATAGDTEKVSLMTEIVDKITVSAKLEEAHVQTVEKSAEEYWTRTNLLFGLLNSNGVV